MADIIIDSFDRSNRTLNGDTADNGQTWVSSGSAAPAINSNELYHHDTGANPTSTIPIGFNFNNNDYTITIKIKTSGNFSNLILLKNGANFSVFSGFSPNFTGTVPFGVYETTTPNFTTIADLSANTWYTIEYLNFDFTAHTHDIKINGTLYDNGGSHYRFYQNYSYFDSISVITANSGEGWFDDIKLLDTAATGWTGKIRGQTNPSKIRGIAVANISKVKGVE